LIIDPNSAVDALVQNDRSRGIIKGDAAGALIFKYVFLSIPQIWSAVKSAILMKSFMMTLILPVCDEIPGQVYHNYVKQKSCQRQRGPS
ncbi:MAG: hypothetical protein P8186_17745, partial [Anaerolineae bacterium]